MRRSLPLAAVLAVLAIAAPAQAQITGSTITSPADPHFVLIDPDAPTAPTVSISGTATGTGSVDIVCLRDYVNYGDVFASNVPVAADGTFAASDVPLISQAGVRAPWSSEATCRLEAWPAGATPTDHAAFSGPRLALTKLTRLRLNAGANAGVVYDAGVLASGVGFSTLARPFGRVGINDASILDPDTFRTSVAAIYNSGSLGVDPPAPRFSLEIDGQAAYPPAVAASGIGSASTSSYPGLIGVEIDVTHFSPTTGDMTVREIDRLVRCAPDNAYPPTAASCQRLVPAGVLLERTTEFSRGDQVTRVVDRWRSTDGHPHRLDLSILQSRCLGSGGYACSAHVAHWLPGDATFVERPNGATTRPIPAGAILSRDATDRTLGGTAVILGQRADRVRFQRDTYNDAFVLDYRARTIPATGGLTLSHTYALTRSADEIEALAAALTPRPAALTPTRATPAEPHATTHPRSPAARVAFRLTRRGVRALTHKRRLRVTVSIVARAGSGAPVTGVRRLTLRLR